MMEEILLKYTNEINTLIQQKKVYEMKLTKIKKEHFDVSEAYDQLCVSKNKFEERTFQINKVFNEQASNISNSRAVSKIIDNIINSSKNLVLNQKEQNDDDGLILKRKYMDLEEEILETKRKIEEIDNQILILNSKINSLEVTNNG